MIDRREHRAFTMVELLVSLSVMSILVIGMASALTISVRSIPVDDAGAKQKDTAWTVDQMAAELAYATSVTAATATDIEFTVERSGAPVSIRYAWAGAAGDPLQRALDGGPLRDVLDGVTEFALGYDYDLLDDAQEPPGVEGPEEILLFQDSSNSGSGSNFDVDYDASLAESFLPDLPADATSWRISRVKFLAGRQNPINGSIRVSVEPAAASGEPSGQEVDFVNVSENDIVNNTWHEIQFADAGGLSPTTPHCIVFTVEWGPGIVARVKTGIGSTGSPETKFYEDLNSTGWTEDPTRDAWLWVAGHATTPDPDWAGGGAAELRSVAITLNTKPTASSRVRTSVTTLNNPSFPAAP